MLGELWENDIWTGGSGELRENVLGRENIFRGTV